MHQADCIFCQIVQGKAPSHQIWSDDKHVAFLSIFPNTEGFTIVIPKEHYGSYAFEQDDKVLSDLVLATKKVALLLDSYFDDVARCGLFFEGYGVDHLHSKLFPMHGTGDNSAWQDIETKHIKTYFDKYPGYLSSNNSERADDENLAELAKKIRYSASVHKKTPLILSSKVSPHDYDDVVNREFEKTPNPSDNAPGNGD